MFYALHSVDKHLLFFIFQTMLVNEKFGKTTLEASLPLSFTYNSSDKKVRSIIIENQPWFSAKDVCDILTIPNSRDAIKALDDDEAMVSEIPTPSRGLQKMQFINESGLYNLIFRSNKPEAKAFRKWVTNEVLPALRKTGRYGVRARCFEPLPAVEVCNAPFGAIRLGHWYLRFVDIDGVKHYIISDILRITQTRCRARIYLAGMLNTGYFKLVKVYGIPNPAWFGPMVGVRLLLHSIRTVEAQRLMFMLTNYNEEVRHA